MISGNQPYYSFVREERLFCALLAHLLLQRGDNLARFVNLVKSRIPDFPKVPPAHLEEAELYLEYAYLRDYWNCLDKDKRRGFLFRLFSQVDGLADLKDDDYPTEFSAFNATFLGEKRGAPIKHELGFPGQWNIDALNKRYGNNPVQFRQLCKLKWAFNIKPDLVIVIPESRLICVEAKLESKTSRYPTNEAERKIFKSRFPDGSGAVGQLELQEFMFETLLQTSCQQIVVGRDKEKNLNVPFLSWEDVFKEMDYAGSASFVERLLKENCYLRR